MTHPAVQTVHDKLRGCGWRHEGYYLMGGQGIWQECGLLPIALDIPCVCCGRGVIAQKVEKSGAITYLLPRSLHRVNIRMLAEPYFSRCDCSLCHTCAFKQVEWVYMIGVGHKHYPNKIDFVREALSQGISKRINALPNDFKVGETWVALAHPRGVTRQGGLSGEVVYREESEEELPLAVVTDDGVLVANDMRYAPAIFGLFKPNRVEYVLSGEESDDFIDNLVKKGITPVMVMRQEDIQLELNNGPAAYDGRPLNGDHAH